MYEAIQRYVNKYPEARCEGISMQVGQPALSRGLIDQAWLTEQGLDQYSRSDGINLGYRPSTDNDAKIIKQQLAATADHDRAAYAGTSNDYLINPVTGGQIKAELIRPLE